MQKRTLFRLGIAAAVTGLFVLQIIFVRYSFREYARDREASRSFMDHVDYGKR